jgi:hypothetical protein
VYTVPEDKKGPHEFDDVPLKALATQVTDWLGLVSKQLRHAPIVGLDLTASLVPGTRVVNEPLKGFLRRLLRDEVASTPEVRDLYGDLDQSEDEAFTAPPDPRASVRSMVQEMLERSMLQSPKQAKEAQFKRIVMQLVPDEVRILNAMADGRPHPAIDAGVGFAGAGVDDAIVRYASTVGIEAGVRWPDQVPVYVAHLKALNLIDLGPADDQLRERYEILETEPAVTDADEAADSRDSESVLHKLSLRKSKHERYTITISDTGRQLWDFADPDTHDYQTPGLE